jgi:hypothetical protein
MRYNVVNTGLLKLNPSILHFKVNMGLLELDGVIYFVGGLTWLTAREKNLVSRV